MLVMNTLLLVPAGSPHYIEPLGGPVLNLDIFCPPRADLAHLLSHLDDHAQGEERAR